ncbi:MAG: prepilin-type N-terminal cleavage/methylation domain-containing protein, partial [Planctomycetota bacterium]
MWKPKYQRNNKGFTFTELLVTIGIIAALAGIGTIAVVKIRGTTNQVTCMNNMKAISNGLQLHFNDYKVFPDDG